jgi:hypothetical protein
VSEAIAATHSCCAILVVPLAKCQQTLFFARGLKMSSSHQAGTACYSILAYVVQSDSLPATTRCSTRAGTGCLPGRQR